jgi:hypothetical protein
MFKSPQAVMNLRFCFAFLIIELQAKGSKLSDLHSIDMKVNLPKKAPKSATNFHISKLDFQTYFYEVKQKILCIQVVKSLQYLRRIYLILIVI